MGISRQILSKDACPLLPHTGTKGWEGSQREANKTCFLLVLGTFTSKMD